MAHYKTNTLTELMRHGLVLKIRCEPCDRTLLDSPKRLYIRYLQDRNWRDLRFVCRRCGRRSRVEVTWP